MLRGFEDRVANLSFEESYFRPLSIILRSFSESSPAAQSFIRFFKQTLL